MFRKVLVANRGEIAVRVIRALREMDIRSVAVYSDADRGALHVMLADEAIRVGPAASRESYLSIRSVIEAAKKTGAEAIHPGYGFLSENADFTKACGEAGIGFIGPGWQAIERMGSKTMARRLAMEVGAPVIPGTEEKITDPAVAKKVAIEIGYPVLLKAAAGGGGKGMRRVDTEAELEGALRVAASEAERAFGSDEVYLEKLLERPRHIEVQVLGDEHGHLIYLGERECSLQRRHQKVVEEAPSPLVERIAGLRERLGETALKMCRAAGYTNAGTLEFLCDQAGNFYFLEMNTRLQVEHPVTEMVTGLDLVEWQLRIAAGERLTVRQEDVRLRGSAIECRVYAEDPEQDYMPGPGEIRGYEEPGGPGVRVDGGVYDGWRVPIDYDPLLAKLVVWGETRDRALGRMRRALGEYFVGGITTNLALFREIMDDAEFRAGRLHTGFLDEMRVRRGTEPNAAGDELVAMVAAALQSRGNGEGMNARVNASASKWGARVREELYG